MASKWRSRLGQDDCARRPRNGLRALGWRRNCPKTSVGMHADGKTSARHHRQRALQRVLARGFGTVHIREGRKSACPGDQNAPRPVEGHHPLRLAARRAATRPRSCRACGRGRARRRRRALRGARGWLGCRDWSTESPRSPTGRRQVGIHASRTCGATDLERLQATRWASTRVHARSRPGRTASFGRTIRASAVRRGWRANARSTDAMATDWLRRQRTARDRMIEAASARRRETT